MTCRASHTTQQHLLHRSRVNTLLAIKKWHEVWPSQAKHAAGAHQCTNSCQRQHTSVEGVQYLSSIAGCASPTRSSTAQLSAAAWTNPSKADSFRLDNGSTTPREAAGRGNGVPWCRNIWTLAHHHVTLAPPSTIRLHILQHSQQQTATKFSQWRYGLPYCTYAMTTPTEPTYGSCSTPQPRRTTACYYTQLGSPEHPAAAHSPAQHRTWNSTTSITATHQP